MFLPGRSSQMAMMAQMQNMFDFPPAPKLDEFGRLKSDKATDQERAGEKVFHGKGRSVEYHAPPFFLDDKMHDLHLVRFYEAEMINDQHNIADGPIKTFDDRSRFSSRSGGPTHQQNQPPWRFLAPTAAVNA